MNKAALKRLAIELRAELGLGTHEPFDPFELAELYGVDVYPLSTLGCAPRVLEHFQVNRLEVFSGALVPVGTGAVIIENDAHPVVRRRSTGGHEMAHVVLEHPFTAALVNEGGCRLANKEHEAEAAELSGELLIPFDAAKRLARRGVTNEEAAAEFEVSVEVARWRLDSTGARKIAARQRAAYTRSASR
ncbi:ImmA/IrrE family metallo-endopeptidase [Actinoplanes sp. NPDC051343]|uniref:ImmA/IrrE family metallo-endopeptidase n=1 Tax=Actinoplanes sp. NPDC051343 TaxID=3363906 RepID=UPI00379C3E87